ncbi:hypothetical protein IEQ34_007876 [Dendrobium chrysotoxum]|uniref:Uncharacterized protein n=1 Tax=Dendrobium chrysotoxum TaxID=161865 RepID=A0AAV7H662_DENCH|nr:hypothetical protein IEQ34_007876 [Dendrobium chrysotoxum]
MRDQSLLQPPSLPSSSSSSLSQPLPKALTKVMEYVFTLLLLCSRCSHESPFSALHSPLGDELASFSGARNKRRMYMKGLSIFHRITSSLDSQPASSGFPPLRYARQIPIKGSGTVSIFFIAFDIFDRLWHESENQLHPSAIVQ